MLKMENVLFLWIQENISNSIPMSQNCITNQAIVIYQKIKKELTDLTEYEKNQLELVDAGRYSVKLRDILNTIETDTLVLKIDIEGYECKVTTTTKDSVDAKVERAIF